MKIFYDAIIIYFFIPIVYNIYSYENYHWILFDKIAFFNKIQFLIISFKKIVCNI